MLIIVLGENKNTRDAHIQKALAGYSNSEVLTLDDTVTSLSDLEQYIYPSLFSLTAPIIHLKFLLDGKIGEFANDYIKKIQASPTIFLFEEFTLPSTAVATLKKHGAEIFSTKDIAKQKTESTIFSVTKAITASDKKSRWFAYREALNDHAIEALIGILYWKIKDFILKGGKDVEKYKKLYHSLITAHAKAWENGTPLELAIEKVILEQ